MLAARHIRIASRHHEGATTASARARTLPTASRTCGGNGYSLVVKRGDPYVTHCPLEPADCVEDVRRAPPGCFAKTPFWLNLYGAPRVEEERIFLGPQVREGSVPQKDLLS